MVRGERYVGTNANRNFIANLQAKYSEANDISSERDGSEHE
jgi:hypothetical protein